MAAIALENAQDRQDLLSTNRRIVQEAAQGVRLIGESPAIVALRSVIRRVADTDLAVLILGENGTGKEVVAQSIHYGSRRAERPFVAVNCAAIPESLAESELFGHEKGAFTDAREARAGKFELAAGGTLFLDEIGDLSLGGQAKLLRVLEEKVLTRVGGSQADPHRRPGDRRHQSEPGGDGAAEAVSRGPLFPPQRGHAGSAAAARPPRGHPAAGPALPQRFLQEGPAARAAVRGRRGKSGWRATSGRATSANCGT